MEPIHGRDVLVSLKIDDEFYPVLCAIDMTFTCTQEVLLATSVGYGSWRKKRLRNLSEWNVSVSGLSKIDNVDGQVSFFYLLQQNVRGSEQMIQVMFSDSDDNVQVIEGVVLIPELSFNGNVSSFADASVTFEGTGPFEITEPVSEALSQVCEVIKSDTWETTPGEDEISGTGERGRSFAGKEILEVRREGIQLDYTSSTPGNREYRYNGVSIFVDPTSIFNEGELMFVMWKE